MHRDGTRADRRGAHPLLAGRPYPCQGGQHACSGKDRERLTVLLRAGSRVAAKAKAAGASRPNATRRAWSTSAYGALTHILSAIEQCDPAAARLRRAAPQRVQPATVARGEPRTGTDWRRIFRHARMEAHQLPLHDLERRASAVEKSAYRRTGPPCNLVLLAPSPLTPSLAPARGARATTYLCRHASQKQRGVFSPLSARGARVPGGG